MRFPDTVPLRDGPVAPWFDRLLAIAVVVGAAWLFVRLLDVTPDPRGFDTHVQLGMAPCGWPLTYGIPCPTCGVTTAACHVMHGQLLQAVVVQPFGAALTIAGLFAAVVSSYCLLRQRSLFDLLVWLPLAKVLLAAIVLLLGSWLYKYLTFVT